MLEADQEEPREETREERNYRDAAERYNHAKAQREKWKKEAKDAEASMETHYDDLQAARSGQSNLSGFKSAEEHGSQG